MASVNVSGRKIVKRKRSGILAGHAWRAYERTKECLREQTEDSKETAYESADGLLDQIVHGVEGELTPLFSKHDRSRIRKSVDYARGPVNVSGSTRRFRSAGATSNETNHVVRRSAAKRYAANNTVCKASKLRNTKGKLRRTAQTISNSVRSILSAARNLVLSLSTGGWIAVVLVVIICIVGLIVSSPFGVFLSGEDTGTGQTMQAAVQLIDKEYTDRLAQIRSSVFYDFLEMSGSRAVWPDVLTVYSVKNTMDPSAPMEAASMTDEKLQLLKDIFWQMNDISHTTRTITQTEIVERAYEDGNIIEVEVEVTKTILYITVAHKTAEEMAQELGFDEAQLLQMNELLSDKYRALWSAVLYGIHSTDEQIVSFALSQVGNIGGEPYWSWYGYESRVEWCACFVSWCANECGYIDTGIIPKFSSCRNGMLWFQARCQWLPRTADPTPGMIVFFDWDDEDGQDGLPDHVGIVQKVENGVIYTIEGNSGDSCKANVYLLGHYEVLGFGCPNY